MAAFIPDEKCLVLGNIFRRENARIPKWVS